ncbi:MAG: hypothetical protein NT062_17340, partial [Proteobacteria bacterium]|nr:hypothetical protein [Pseudomonadota bacterium]
MNLACVALTGLAVLVPHVASAEGPPPPTIHERALSDITGSYQLQLAMTSAGPILFKDTPDRMLEKTSAFEYGGRLAFLLGNERLDAHRFGLGIAYDLAARSDSRKLALITPQLIYETGHPLILQLAVGAAIGNGT